MNTLFIINETFTNGYNTSVLNIISIASIICGIFVIISKNPIISVLFLIGLFLSISSYLIIIGINFIGLSYLLVYIGAVSILFIFILMLINVRISELFSDASNSVPLAIFISIAFNYSVYQILPYSITGYNYDIINISNIIGDMLNNSYNDYINKAFILNDDYLDNNDILLVSSKV